MKNPNSLPKRAKKVKQKQRKLRESDNMDYGGFAALARGRIHSNWRPTIGSVRPDAFCARGHNRLHSDFFLRVLNCVISTTEINSSRPLVWDVTFEDAGHIEAEGTPAFIHDVKRVTSLLTFLYSAERGADFSYWREIYGTQSS